MEYMIVDLFKDLRSVKSKSIGKTLKIHSTRWNKVQVLHPYRNIKEVYL